MKSNYILKNIKYPNILKGELIIYHAGSLTVPFEALEKEFKSLHPGITIKRTAGGSRELAKKVSEFGDKVDILCSADYAVIDSLLMSKHANWNALFAKNSMVIMFSKNSKFAQEITSDNWYEILLRDEVNYGHSDSNADPCGYRTFLLWQLAEKYYAKDGLSTSLDKGCPDKNIRLKSFELISLLETGALDYAFEYESVGFQRSKLNPELKYIKLPEEINLSSITHKDFYAESLIELTGKEPGTFITVNGQPIVYSLTMPKSGENNDLAIEFLKFLFDKDTGLKILQEAGQPVLEEITVFKAENLPFELQYLTE